MPLHAPTFASLAVGLAKADHHPARKATYLVPLQTLHSRCSDGTVSGLGTDVNLLSHDLAETRLVAAPNAAAEAALASEAKRGASCAALATSIRREVIGPLRGTRSLYSGWLRFSPPLTAELALAAIRHGLKFGKVRVVYSLTAYSCQQEIFMGPAIARRYRNPDLGAFVQLTSGRGVGHGKYDANRVDRARISPLGRIGGQPCR